MQGFKSESFVMVGGHSQIVKAPTITNDSGLKDCVNLSPSNAVSTIMALATVTPSLAIPEDLAKFLHNPKNLLQISPTLIQKISKQFQEEIAVGKKIVAVDLTSQDPGFVFVYQYIKEQKPSLNLLTSVSPSFAKVVKEQLPTPPFLSGDSAEVNQKTGYAYPSVPAASAATVYLPTAAIQAPSKSLVSQPIQKPSIAYGAEQWKKYFGDVGLEPPLPEKIHEMLNSPCPFIKGKKKEETHLLVLIPATLNGQPLTLKRLGALMHTLDSKLGIGGYTYPTFVGHGDTFFESTHWVMMTKTVIKGSRCKSYVDQEALVARYPGYEVPRLSEAVSSIYMHYVVTGQRLYPQGSYLSTYTRCQEKYSTYAGCQEKDNADWQMVVGGFAPAGLFVQGSFYDIDRVGVAGLWKF